jgi:hypothetical protein
VSRDEEARSTDRPPSPDDDAHPDIASAIQRAKTNASPGRYGPPQATAKIGAFDLAQALALTTRDDHSPSSSKPPREDDAPFVGGEVEVVGEVDVPSGVPSSGKKRSTHPASVKTPHVSIKPEALAKLKSKPPIPPLPDDDAIVPATRSKLGLVILATIVGLIVIAYVYVRTR